MRVTLAVEIAPAAVPDGVRLLLESDFERAVQLAEGELLVFAQRGALLCDGWLEGVLRAHRLGWAAVGPSVRASGTTPMANAFQRLCFGAWAAPAAPQPHSRLPLGLSSYKLPVLRTLPAQELGDERRVQRYLGGLGVRLFTDTRVEVTIDSPRTVGEFWRRLQATGRSGHAAPRRWAPPPISQWPWLALGQLAISLGAIQRVFSQASNQR